MKFVHVECYISMRHVVRKVGATLGCLSLELRGKTNIGPQMMVWKGGLRSKHGGRREERLGHSLRTSRLRRQEGVEEPLCTGDRTRVRIEGQRGEGWWVSCVRGKVFLEGERIRCCREN